MAFDDSQLLQAVWELSQGARHLQGRTEQLTPILADPLTKNSKFTKKKASKVNSKFTKKISEIDSKFMVFSKLENFEFFVNGK